STPATGLSTLSLHDALPILVETVVGYAGGTTSDATYDEVKTGRTGHAESVRIVFDPDRLSYEDLLGYFFRMHDPTTMNRQGNDRSEEHTSELQSRSELVCRL